jgi:hypothetical protein
VGVLIDARKGIDEEAEQSQLRAKPSVPSMKTRWHSFAADMSALFFSHFTSSPP